MKKNFWSYSTIFCLLLTIIVHAGQPQEQTPQVTPKRQKIIHALRIDKSIQLASETLAYYATQNNLEAFRATLQQHPEQLNSLDNRGLTPLQEAVCAGSKDIVEELCTAADLNINIEQYSSTGCTALHYAIEYASLCSCKGTRICNRCLILNSILDYYRSNGIKDRNPVMQSRYRIRYYIPFIYKPLDEWLTPLHIAAIRGDQKLVKLLLENGADPNKLTYGQISPLHYAAYYCGNGLDYYEIASLLCRNRARLDQEDRYYTTPLAMAIRSQITEHDTEKSATAKEKMVTYLLQQGANANHRDMLGTPLTQSVKKSSPEGITLALLDAHADTQATDRDGRTALDLTVTGNNPQEKIQRTLMRLNARLTLPRATLQSKGIQANWLLFPIHEAADSGDLTRVKSLLQNKHTRHLIGQDMYGKYPLHYAVRGNHQEIVYYLLTKNDRSHNSADIATHPIADAIELGLYDMVEILLDRLPENYLTNHGEQLLDYIKTCKQKNKEILEKEKAGTITIDSVQYSMDTLVDWYDAIARLLVTRGATKHNLLKWAIINKLPLLTTYLIEQNPEALKDRSDSQDALELAINSKDPVIMKLLITHGALRSENDTYLGIIQKLVDQQGLRETYLNLVDPRTIARSLHGTNLQDNVTRSLEIHKTYLNTINLCGRVEPALSSDLGKENYSGYYALYNAICWAQGYGHTYPLNTTSITKRKDFIPFFESMLTFLHEHINPPYDNLRLENIDLLIQYIRNSGTPVSQETLKNIALIDLSDIELIMEEQLARNTSEAQPAQPSKLTQTRQELYHTYTEVFDRFTDRTRPDRTDNIAVIVTSKNYPALWFTVCFKRNTDSSVTFQIYDSINSLKIWEQDSLYRMCNSGIIQLWYMATHIREQWPTIFTHEIQESIKTIRSRIEARNPKKPVAEFLRDLEIFIDALGGLQETAKDYQISTAEAKEFAFIHTLRYARFYQEYEIFYYTLLSLIDSKTISGPIAENANEFIEKHMPIEEIEKALTLLAHEQHASLEARNKAWHMVITKIQNTIQEALTIRTALAQQARTPIDKEMVSIVEHNLHDELRLVINDLKKKTDDKSTRILLYGEPGTGKTTFGQALAQLCLYTEGNKQKPRQFLIFRIPLIGTKYKFSIQEKLTELKDFIQKNPHAVIILDELDALSDNDAISDTKKYAYYTALQNFLDDTIQYPCIFIATTNVDVQNDTDKTFPDPLLSRFQRKVKIEKPSHAYRLAIIQYYTAKNANIVLTRQEEEELANMSSGFSIRDIESMFTLAAQHATQSPESAITMHNFRATLKTMKSGRRINIRRIAHVGLKALASCGGPAWLNFGLSLLSMLMQHSQHLDDIKRSERHLYEDRIQHLQERLFDIQQGNLQADLVWQRTLHMDGVNHSRSLTASRDSMVQQFALACFSQGLSVLSTSSQQQPAQP
jgi:ankyrin repeat protein/AAA+ superfamily predicted ATPase